MKQPSPKRPATLKRHEELRQLGIRIKTARKIAGYRQAIEFIKKALPNITTSRYYQWERGLRKPTDDALRKISEFAKINYDWLKNGDADPFDGIKIAASEKDTKKAILIAEIFAEKFAEDKDLIPFDAADKLFKVATEESFNKETKIVYVVNTELMEAILNELINTYNAKSISIKAKNLSKFAAQIYADIVENEDDRNLQLKMVKIATSAYKRAIKK